MQRLGIQLKDRELTYLRNLEIGAQTHTIIPMKDCVIKMF